MYKKSINHKGKNNPMFGKRNISLSIYNTRTKKGKTFEEQYGSEKAKKIKNKMKNRTPNMLGKSNKWGHHTDEVKLKISKKQRGELNGMYTCGIRGYRKRALEKYGYVCNRCGIKEKRVLLVHHKDENRRNNKIENLEVMCLNCHALHHRFGFKYRCDNCHRYIKAKEKNILDKDIIFCENCFEKAKEVI